jgi:hypothetical protein
MPVTSFIENVNFNIQAFYAMIFCSGIMMIMVMVDIRRRYKDAKGE